MYKEGTESWRIVESSDLSLNFALFVGRLYGLIDDINGINYINIWPPKCENNELAEPSSLLKEQWNKWLNSMINDGGKKVILKKEFDPTNNMFNPPNFSELPYCELREFCKNSWQVFIELC